MTSKQTDRLGNAPEEGIKAPVVVSTIADLTPIQGLPSISGIQLVANDRVLVRNQTDKSENGIYNAAAGVWDRSTDWNKPSDVINGQIVVDANDGIMYKASFSGAFTIDVTEVDFNGASDSFLISATNIQTQTATSDQTVFTVQEYIPGSNLSIYVNGVRQVDDQYVETSSTIVTFNEGLFTGDRVTFIVLETPSLEGNIAASNVTYLATDVASQLTVNIAAIAAIFAVNAISSGTLLAGRVNELLATATFTLPLANSVSANDSLVVELSDKNSALTPTVQRAGSDTITDSAGTDTDVILDSGSVSLRFISDGISDWRI